MARFVVHSRSVTETQKTAGFDRLIEELAKSQRSPDACTEALFLAALGRSPLETERSFCSQHIGKAADRREGLGDELFHLTNTRECKEHVAELQSQSSKLPGR